MSAPSRGAVVIGGSITGLSSLRALASHGVAVALVATSPHDVAPFSRFARETHALLEFEAQPGSLLDLLERHSGRWRGRVLLTNHDEVATLLARHRERLESWYRIVTPPWETTRHVMQKDLTYAVAQRVGVDVPRMYGAASPEVAARSDILFPVVVKPVESRPFFARFGVKLLVAGDRDELRRHVRDVQDAGLRADPRSGARPRRAVPQLHRLHRPPRRAGRRALHAQAAQEPTLLRRRPRGRGGARERAPRADPSPCSATSDGAAWRASNTSSIRATAAIA